MLHGIDKRGVPHGTAAAAFKYGLAIVAALVLGVMSGAAGLGPPSRAETLNGQFCPMVHLRVNGAPGMMLREKLWEYAKDKAPEHAMFGWVDVACWNASDATPIDIAQRAWFGVARRGNVSEFQSKLEFADPRTMSSFSAVGVTAEGLSIIGNVSPGHECVFAVYVWAETCPPR